MSLIRLVIWSSLIGGWAAFASWLITEVPFHAWIDAPNSPLAVALAIAMATIVAIAIGGGVSLASGLTNPSFGNLAKRLALGLAGGLVGGLLASLLGACVFFAAESITVLGYVGRVFGWTLIGVAVGVTEGIIDRNLKKIRNGLIGGGVGGFFAGLLFVPITLILSSTSSRAFSFVLLGLCIGFFIGLAQVILKQAWLTVESGFRPGRQMILGSDVITMGTSEKSSIIFIAMGAKGVEPTHLKITKQPSGAYLLEDNQSRTGTLLNGQAVQGAMQLKDGDAIQLGINVVRFNEREKHAGAPTPVVTKPAPAAPVPAPPAPAPKPAPAPVAAAPKPAPAPKPVAAAPKPVAAPKSEAARCPICDKSIVGVPGQRRCGTCFTTF